MTVFSANLYSFASIWLAYTLAQWNETPPAELVTLAVFLTVFGAWSIARPLSPSQGQTTAVGIASLDYDPGVTVDDATLDAKRAQLLRIMVDVQGQELIVLPETAYTYRLEQSDVVRGRVFADAGFGQAASGLGRDVMIGSYLQQSKGATNSAVLIGRDGTVSAQYDKRLLVPLFEREYQAGERTAIFRTTTGKSFTTLICYELYFPWFVQRSLARAPEASFLVNLSSDWYLYDTEAIPHVVSQVRLRAIENQVPIVRAARFGPSGVFHQDGRHETRAISESGVALSVAVRASERAVFSRFACAPFLGVLLALSVAFRLRCPSAFSSSVPGCVERRDPARYSYASPLRRARARHVGSPWLLKLKHGRPHGTMPAGATGVGRWRGGLRAGARACPTPPGKSRSNTDTVRQEKPG